MEIIETPVFTKRILEFLTDDEYRELQWTLITNPMVGSVIPGGRGLRKLRWAVSGGGKRGGLRIIYYWFAEEEKIYMMISYKKSQQENLTKEQLRILNDYVKEGVL